MRILLNRSGLFVIFRLATLSRQAIGFKIKPAGQMLFSERYGYVRGWKIGPIYVGTYKRLKPDWTHTDPRAKGPSR